MKKQPNKQKNTHKQKSIQVKTKQTHTQKKTRKETKK